MRFSKHTPNQPLLDLAEDVLYIDNHNQMLRLQIDVLTTRIDALEAWSQSVKCMNCVLNMANTQEDD